jgi:integrase
MTPLTDASIRAVLKKPRSRQVDLLDGLQGKRDRALLSLAYTLMARRSELVALNVEDFEIHADGSATVSFERLKTGRATNHVSPEVMAVVGDWLAKAHIQGGAIFLRLDSARGGARSRLTPRSVGLTFKRIARGPGPAGRQSSEDSSHSARIGATHDLIEDGASDAAMMRDAGWKTPRMVGMYSRGAKAKRGAMAARLKGLAPSFAIEGATEASAPKPDPTLTHPATGQ